MRYCVGVHARHMLPFILGAACQPSPANHTGFGSSPELTTAASTGPGSTSSSSSGTTGPDSDSSAAGPDSTSEAVRDLGGMPDFGDDSPAGCQGKIDFLFVISRQTHMRERQEQLAKAFPQFIATIESKFADFDYHIMVIAGDDGWGNDLCTDLCPTVDCKVGDPCCNWYEPTWVGEQCCDLTYPCDDLDLVTKCDRTWGAGEVFPAGVSGEANKPCPIDGDGRFLARGQTNLKETFECIASVGNSGYGWLGHALTAAMQKPINDPGGCNHDFLRDDALLMVTFIANGPDEPGESEGTPAEWAQAVIDAKHGDKNAVVMFNIGGCEFFDKYGDQCLLVPEGECHPIDRLCQVTTMFPYHHSEDGMVADYGPAFVEAASLVETACAGFTPPPG
jgi:hypothetical protein